VDDAATCLYAVEGDGTCVRSFSLATDGSVRAETGCVPSGGVNPVHLTLIGSTGRLVIANHNSGTLGIVRLAEDGAVESLESTRTLRRPTPQYASAQSHPHQVVLDDVQRVLFVPDKGLDCVFKYRVDLASSVIDQHPVSIAESRPGSGPRHVVSRPETSRMYVINELDATISTYKTGANGACDEQLASFPATPQRHSAERITGAEIVFVRSPDRLYVSTRGSNAIATCVINPDSGIAEPRAWQPSGGDCPRHMAIDPWGDQLYVANERSDCIVNIPLDMSSLHSTVAEVIRVPTGSPVCVVFSTLDR
jgi:6-phosphogluconolactonase (cycloisomerase 2 family)